jgi:hypothetical protein
VVPPVWAPAAQKAGADLLRASAEAASGLLAAIVRGAAKSIMSKETVRATAVVQDAGLIEPHPSLEMLGKAIGSAAKQLGGEVVDAWRDCNDQNHACVAAIRTAKFPRGVGVQVEADGEVIFVHDANAGDAAAAKEIEVAVRTQFNVVNAAEFLCREGYQVDVHPTMGSSGQVVLSVVGSRQY